MRALRLLVCTFVILCASNAGAVDLDGDEHNLRLAPHVEVLHDPGGTLAPIDVLDGKRPFRRPERHPDLNFGYTADVLWLKLPVRSLATGAREWRIEFEYATVDRIDLYSVGDDGILHQRSGDRMVFAQRSQPHRNPVFALRLAAGESRTLYLRAESLGSLTLSSALWDADRFFLHSQRGYAATSLYFGAALALALYNLLLFAILRERAILIYVAFVVSFATGIVAVTGFGAQFLWPNAIDFGNRLLGVGFAASSLLATMYARSYLDTARHAPRWHRVLGLLLIAHAAVLAVALFGPIRLSFQLMSAGGVLNAVLIFGCGLHGIWRRIPGARVLTLAWFALLTGALLMSLRNFGILPTNFLTANAMAIGSALEMLLLSFGLAARFNELKRQKAEAQAQLLSAQQEALRVAHDHERQLAQHVAERTAQLEVANARLHELAMHDPLTGLANRTALEDYFRNAFEQRRDHLRVLLIDLDGFKHVNDRFGHGVGDRVLAEVARRIRDSGGRNDIAARLGGDEFVVVTPDARGELAVRALSDRIRASVAMPIRVDDGVVHITASIGVAGLDRDTPDARELLQRADRAMYAAKMSGGNRSHWAEE